MLKQTIFRRTFLQGILVKAGLLSMPLADAALAREARQPVHEAETPAYGDYDVRRFGAIWDGDSHPLSERFATLEDARRVYPHAGAMSDETDWAAVQAAVNRIVLVWAERGERYGGTVELPPGTGRLNRAIFYPANSVWLHESFPVANFQGQGRSSTLLEWRDNAADIEGGYVLQPRTAAVIDGAVVWSGDHAHLHADCRLSGFALRGPGNWHGFPAPATKADFIASYGFEPEDWTTAYNRDNPRLGQLHEAYGGLSAGENTSLRDIYLQGFHVGLNWRGGQKQAELVYTQNCYYGVYLTFTEGAHGDFVLRKCNFSGRFAAIAIAPDGAWFGHLDTCYIGNSPYGFYKEGTPEAMPDSLAAVFYRGHWSSFLTGVLTYCQFESIGNSIICEGNLSRRHQIRDLTLQNCAYIDWQDFSFPKSPTGYRDAILDDALIDAARWSRVTIARSHDPHWWKPRDVAIFRCGIAEDVAIDSCDGFILAARAAGKTLFHSDRDPAQPDGGIKVSGNRWAGAVVRCDPSAAAIEAGDLVGLYGLSCGRHSPSAFAFLGVAMETNPDFAKPRHIAVATSFVAAGLINFDAAGMQQGDGWKPSEIEPGKAAAAEGAARYGVALAPGGPGQWWSTLGTR